MSEQWIVYQRARWGDFPGVPHKAEVVKVTAKCVFIKSGDWRGEERLRVIDIRYRLFDDEMDANEFLARYWSHGEVEKLREAHAKARDAAREATRAYRAAQTEAAKALWGLPDDA